MTDTQDNQGEPKGRTGDTPLDSISIAAFDVDARIFRTMRDYFLSPVAVATAAIEHDYSRYLSPIRVYIALFSFQFVAAAIFGTPATATIETMTAGVDIDFDVWLASSRMSFDTPLTLERVESELKAVQSLTLWPLAALSSLPYLLALKLYRPSIPLWGHLQLYLAVSNVSFIVMIALIPMHTLGGSGMMISMAIGAVIFFVYAGILLAHFYGRSVTALVLRLAGLVAVFPITMLITIIGTLLTVDWVLGNSFGLDLMTLSASGPSAEQSSP
ncbi:DUF3667 domain-containing protein [Maricaulis sp.]|uniref:DUF3667 domain-containing protein n=1 Tax=Maricaulis sp. TaxID=1486257 RepID=UPI0025E7E059|nr:DUF3667 domain-containing protein [Maricaulis sp.]MDF1768785.1 DUF3667 domain-containing protein [Maricaulis sp.]